ncbi:FK506-binding protein, partial [Capsaspora owczarzaki ATCC 30864]
VSSFVAASLVAAAAAAAAGESEKLQIGIKKRVENCERKAASRDKVSVHYTGMLTDNSVFDSSVTRGTPFEFTLGAGQVIKGWDQGIVGMCVGEKRRLTIPSHLGYGDRGSPPKIPPKATLIFDVELLEIKNAGRDL